MANKEFKGLFNTALNQPDSLWSYTDTGFRYAVESENFLFVLTVEINKFRQISPFFGIQPKAITQMGDFMTHNFKKIAPQDCELTIQLIPSLEKPFWNVTRNSEENDKVAIEVFEFVDKHIVPIINKYMHNPNLLDKVEPIDLSDNNMMHQKLYGMQPAGMQSRTAWMLAIYYEKKDIARAKAFARYGLENLGAPTVQITPEIKKMLDEGLIFGNVFGSDPEEDTFFGTPDMKRIDKL